MREHAADLYDALKLTTGVLCESGDLNNYRNVSDVELGSMWIATGKHAGHLMNLIDGLPNEFHPLARHLSFPAAQPCRRNAGEVSDESNNSSPPLTGAEAVTIDRDKLRDKITARVEHINSVAHAVEAERSRIVALLTSDAAIELAALRLAGRFGSDWEDAQEALKDAVRDAARSACSAFAEMIEKQE